MKETVKKIIVSVMAMATISIFFGGCSKQDTSSNSTPITSSISTSYTSSSVSSSITPGADTSTDVTDNSLFHWVEEPAGSEAAVTAFELRNSNDCQVDTANNNEYDLPVYIKDSERYMHAGNLLLQLDEDGGFVNEEDEMLVRHIHEPDTASGAKIYLYRNPTDESIKQLCQDNLADNEAVSKSVDKFWNTLGGQVPTEHNPYVVDSDTFGTIPDNALVWYNGIATDARAINSMIPLKVLTDDFMNILSYTKTESGYTFNLYTGIGIVGVSAIKSDVWTFSYSIPVNCKLEQSDVILPSTSISEKGDGVYVSADVLTQVFKYFVFTFSSVDMGDGSTEDIAVIVTDNQDILKSSQSSDTTDGSSNSDTSSDTSDTSDTHEPTSEPTSSSSGSTGETSKPDTNTSKPTGETSKPDTSTSKPTGETSKPSTSTSTSTPASPYWNPDAPGNKPGPYGGYYDASGAFHAKADSVPLDSTGAPVVSFWTEYGSYRMTRAEKDAAREATERIDNGGEPNWDKIDWDSLP